MKRCLLAVAVAACLLMGTVTSAQASAITLFNTGVDGSGTVLPNGTVGDAHYSLVSVPGGTTQTMVRTSVGGFPIGPWVGDNALSAWIGPNSNSEMDGPAGNYDYQTTFDLTGLNPGTAIISGQWSMDDQAVSIRLNGNDTGNSGGGFGSFTPFSISSGFQAGINTLDFIVLNGPISTGVRVEMTGTASPSGAVVPEPGSLLVLGLGLTAVVGMSCTKRRKTVLAAA